MSEEKTTDTNEKERQEKERSSIDRLFQDIKQYTTGPEFLKKLEFYIKFPYIGAYNAALVAEQRPGARFVLTARAWKKKDRKIKLDARPVMILLPFYPVEFLFDVSDTEPIYDNPCNDDQEIIEDIIHEHIASCKHSVYYYYDNLNNNLPKFGISYNRNYIVGTEIHAKTVVSDSVLLHVKALKDMTVTTKSHFVISIDSKADDVGALALLFHELAHIFCHHIEHSWLKKRSCTTNEKEFEAETVSFLVCRRLGIEYDPKEYLAGYIKEDRQIPDISLDFIFRAVDQIEQMAKGYIEINKGFLYKHDDTFKRMVDEERERIKKR